MALDHEQTEGAEVLLMGNEAIARGALEAGVRVAAGYPGTPSSEIIETLSRFRKRESSMWSGPPTKRWPWRSRRRPPSRGSAPSA